MSTRLEVECPQCCDVFPVVVGVIEELEVMEITEGREMLLLPALPVWSSIPGESRNAKDGATLFRAGRRDQKPRHPQCFEIRLEWMTKRQRR